MTPTAAGPATCQKYSLIRRIATDHLQIVASVARLADDQARLCGVAGEIERIDPLGLQPVDESR